MQRDCARARGSKKSARQYDTRHARYHRDHSDERPPAHRTRQTFPWQSGTVTLVTPRWPPALMLPRSNDGAGAAPAKRTRCPASRVTGRTTRLLPDQFWWAAPGRSNTAKRSGESAPPAVSAYRPATKRPVPRLHPRLAATLGGARRRLAVRPAACPPAAFAIHGRQLTRARRPFRIHPGRHTGGPPGPTATSSHRSQSSATAQAEHDRSGDGADCSAAHSIAPADAAIEVEREIRATQKRARKIPGPFFATRLD
jgi:hypothetical protein